MHLYVRPLERDICKLFMFLEIWSFHNLYYDKVMAHRVHVDNHDLQEVMPGKSTVYFHGPWAMGVTSVTKNRAYTSPQVSTYYGFEGIFESDDIFNYSLGMVPGRNGSLLLL